VLTSIKLDCIILLHFLNSINNSFFEKSFVLWCCTTLIFGTTGSGKTTRAINPLLLQLLEQGCGRLVFDIKGDFHKTIGSLGQKINAPYTAIGASQTLFNLLSGSNPEIASSFLKLASLPNDG